MKDNLMTSRRITLRCSLVVVLLHVTSLAAAQTEVPQGEGPASASAPVVVDGRVLFPVQGIPSYSAEERGRAISARIRELARDKTFSPGELTLVEAEDHTAIMFGEKLVAAVHDLDASAQGISRALLTEVVRGKISGAVRAYREERDPERLLMHVGYAAVALLAMMGLLFLLWRLSRHQEAWIERRYRSRVRDVRIRSFQLVQAERLWDAVKDLVLGVRTLITILLIVAGGEFILKLFPWTRPLADQALALVVIPLVSMTEGMLEAIPGLLFIAVLVLVLRYILKFLRLFFAAVENGKVRLSGFEAEWSWPTYKLLRLATVAFGIVVAYPYVPGAETAAFKGVSLFLGLVLSLGSTSAVSNIIAGYTLTYRSAFKVGDRVQIGDVTGDVIQIRHQVTHLCSLKNEEVVIPNSSILNSHVVNYTSLARERGLILHTTVGIGYETPWRQVEAMLQLAAGRTHGLLDKPSPFVLQKALGDFCVTYELNVYTELAHESMRICTELHRNILDVFNEYGIQIMTPAYESDPPDPKVVPREKWYEDPASTALEAPSTGTSPEPPVSAGEAGRLSDPPDRVSRTQS